MISGLSARVTLIPWSQHQLVAAPISICHCPDPSVCFFLLLDGVIPTATIAAVVAATGMLPPLLLRDQLFLVEHIVLGGSR